MNTQTFRPAVALMVITDLIAYGRDFTTTVDPISRWVTVSYSGSNVYATEEAPAK